MYTISAMKEIRPQLLINLIKHPNVARKNHLNVVLHLLNKVLVSDVSFTL